MSSTEAFIEAPSTQKLIEHYFYVMLTKQPVSSFSPERYAPFLQ